MKIRADSAPESHRKTSTSMVSRKSARVAVPFCLGTTWQTYSEACHDGGDSGRGEGQVRETEKAGLREDCGVEAQEKDNVGKDDALEEWTCELFGGWSSSGTALEETDVATHAQAIGKDVSMVRRTWQREAQPEVYKRGAKRRICISPRSV